MTVAWTDTSSGEITGRPISVKSEPPTNNTYNNVADKFSYGLYSNKANILTAEGL